MKRNYFSDLSTCSTIKKQKRTLISKAIFFLLHFILSMLLYTFCLFILDIPVLQQIHTGILDPFLPFTSELFAKDNEVELH